MDGLGNDALQQVLQHLDWQDLMAAGAACRQLRSAAAANSPLWRGLCTRRWHGPLNTWFPAPPPQLPANSASAPAAPQQQQRVDYRALFLQDNGWTAPTAGLAQRQWAGSSWNDEVVAVQPAVAANGSTLVAVSSSRELRLLRIDSSPTAAMSPLRAGVHTGHGGSVQWSSLAVLPGGDGSLVAAGSCHGSVTLWRLPEWRSVMPAQATAEQVAALAFPGNNSLVGELHHLPHCNRLAALLDPLALLRPGAQQTSTLSVLDAATWTEAGPPMRDVLDGYELAAAVPASSQGGGCEFIAGSVKLSDDQASGWPCRRCYTAAPAATCFHKSPASAAALCFLDGRAQRGMVARYATHHRSLYPHLEIVREHFLLTSHAGVPLAVWDRRRMNGPVHEVQHIPRELDPQLAASLPLGDPGEHELPTSQALHLSATADLLVGRADNGMCWLFDLSERLGWADGSHPGSWLHMQHSGPQPGQAAAAGPGGGQADAAAGGAVEEGEEDWEMAEAPDAEEEGHLDERDFDRAPLPLGCIGAPFEVWCSNGEEAPPLHWLPRAAAWVSHSHQLLALGGLELEDKQRLFPAYAQGSPYPSNALVLASLCRRQ